jgi:hypothetical protein
VAAGVPKERAWGLKEKGVEGSGAAEPKDRAGNAPPPPPPLLLLALLDGVGAGGPGRAEKAGKPPVVAGAGAGTGAGGFGKEMALGAGGGAMEGGLATAAEAAAAADAAVAVATPVCPSDPAYLASRDRANLT